MKKIAIVQSNYVPWKGYFDLIRSVDEFILYDDAQYTKRDWRNRNCIKTANGIQWLTIPVHVKGKFDQRIKDTRVSDPLWSKRHWQTIDLAYKKSDFYGRTVEFLKPLYLSSSSDYLSEINKEFIGAICRLLSIKTHISQSMDYEVGAGLEKSERLLDLCIKSGASVYLSGPSASGYLDTKLFLENGIRVEYMDYEGYSEYPQLYGGFVHQVSIVDLLFNAGPSASSYLNRSNKGGPK